MTTSSTHPNPVPAPGESPRRRLIVVDPCYERLTGHNHAFDTLIAEHCRRRSISCTVMANLALGSATAAVPVFRQGIYSLTAADSVDALRTSFLLAASFAEDLGRHVTPLLVAPSTVLLHTANAPLLHGFAHWAQSLPTTAGIRFRLGFNFPPAFRERRREVAEINACLCRVALFLLRARFSETRSYAETEELRQIYASLGAPAPEHKRLPSAVPMLPTPTAERRDGEPMVCYAPGECRPEKGHGFLINTLLKVAQRQPPWLRNLRFRFSLTAIPDNVVALLRSRPDIFELAPDASQSNDVYWRLLSEADLVYCGYDPAEYSARASGIFNESLALGRPVVVCRGTSMANELARCGTPFGVVAEYGNHESLAAALELFVSQRKAIDAAAASMAAMLRADLDPGPFLEWLIHE